jgi:5-methyltetrahydrofolate--homocysteine methyltransferase
VNMKEVIEMARGAGADCTFMIGGAVVTRAYADTIGAHYAKDGVEAVRVVQNLIGQ